MVGIEQEASAHIDHCCGPMIPGKGLPKLDSWGRREVFFDQALESSSKPIFLEDFQPQSCIAQSPGDKKVVSNSCPASEKEASFLALSQKADIDDDLFRERSISSDQVHSKSFCSVLETPAEERDARKRKIL